jgi:TonB family protein
MLLAESRVSKFIIISTAIHFALVASIIIMTPQEDKVIPIQISFGKGTSPAGSGGRLAQPKLVVETPKKIERVLPKQVSVDDVVLPLNKQEAHVEEVMKTQQAAIAREAVAGTGDGTGETGIGTGTGIGNGTGEGINSVRAKYGSMIAKLINDKKRYPRTAKAFGQEGMVKVKLKLDKLGNILELDIIEKSPHESLAKASLETIKSVNKFPAIPNELGVEEISLNIPINYTLQM